LAENTTVESEVFMWLFNLLNRWCTVFYDPCPTSVFQVF